MYSRVARAKFDTSKSEEVIKIAQEAIGKTQSLPGFRSVSYHYDRSSGWGISVSIWDTKEQADAAAEGIREIVEAFTAFRVKQQGAADVIDGPLPTFEVVAQG
jgi:quinol monooxygenase YgiN